MLFGYCILSILCILLLHIYEGDVCDLCLHKRGLGLPVSYQTRLHRSLKRSGPAPLPYRRKSIGQLLTSKENPRICPVLFRKPPAHADPRLEFSIRIQLRKKNVCCFRTRKIPPFLQQPP